MLLTNEYCYKCLKMTSHHDSKCGNCETREEIENRYQHFLKLDNLTLDERVRKIEEMIYNWKNNAPWDWDKY